MHYLQIQGKLIVNQKGEAVSLRGVHMGGLAAFNYHASLRYDLSKDSYESLLEKWTRGLTRWQDPFAPRNHTLNQWWVDGFRQSGGRAESGR